ncbi:MAG: hypothetical protein IT323_08160 [Anaerolineae bacterium]|nr:hypothetical protein [Anaerolineae bacterium]
MKTIRWIVLTVVIVGLALGVAARSAIAQEQDDTLSADARSLLYEVRGETADFRDVDLALEAGYGKFLDCFTLGDEMGMGQHYVNGELAGDDVLDALRPEALVYEPRHDGSMILVAFEYLVFADVWDPHNTGREAPTLFGQAFHLKTNIPETPPVWALHLWLWSHNPEGLFADYNPIVSCPDDQPVIDMSMS